MSLVTLEGMHAAAERIPRVFTGTPQFELEAAGQRLGMRILAKLETLNPIRSFKGRGTEWFLEGVTGRAPLVCASAGNFGQGLAWGCRRRGLRLTVFAAQGANPLKLERMRALGAEVHQAGADFDAAKEAARDHAARQGVPYVEDGAEPRVAEGAGTIAVELCAWPEPIDAVLVPLGNGALLNGISRWMKAYSPRTEVIGVCATGAPAMERSWKSGAPVSTPRADTIADGIAVRVPVPLAVEEMRGRVDDVLLVDDAAIRAAMRSLFRDAGLVVEPAGAVGIAAAEVYRERFQGRLVATPLCGGNLTAELAREWLFD